MLAMSHWSPALEVRADNLVNATVGEAAACLYRKQLMIHQHMAVASLGPLGVRTGYL